MPNINDDSGININDESGININDDSGININDDSGINISDDSGININVLAAMHSNYHVTDSSENSFGSLYMGAPYKFDPVSKMACRRSTTKSI